MKISYLPYRIATSFLLIILTINLFCSSVNASTQKTKLTLDQISAEIDLNMSSGSSIRIVENSTGLRFVSHINNNTYLTLKDDYDISFGTIIIPNDYLLNINETTFTKQYLDTNDIEYLNIPQQKWFSVDESTNLRYFSAAITNILDKNLTRNFIARSYYDIEINGNINTIYSPNSIDNARNLYELTQAVLENDSLTSSQTNILYSILNRVGISFNIIAVNSETDLTFDYDFETNFYVINYEKERKYYDYVCFTIYPKNEKYELNRISKINVTGKGKTSNVTHNNDGTLSFLYSIDSYIYSNLH